jgi:hypothetical protein
MLRGVKIIMLRRNNIVSALAIGIVAAMFTLWFHSMLEWLFRQTYMTVQFFMLAGFLMALPRVDLATRKKIVMRSARMNWWYQTFLQQRPAVRGNQ